jgi:hypothetical protein
MNPLAGSFPLKLPAEILNHGNELVGRGVHLALLILKIEENPDAGLHDLQQGILGARLFTTQTCLLGHDQDLKGRRRLDCGHQTEESRPTIAELAPLIPSSA